MRFHIPSDVIWIMQQITGQKEEVFLVGGCVRDLLLNRPVHDYDMTTSMPAEAMISLFSQLDCNVVPTGLKHGTVTIIRRHQAVEITTYRTESSYLQHRRLSSRSRHHRLFPLSRGSKTKPHPLCRQQRRTLHGGCSAHHARHPISLSVILFIASANP